MALVLNDRVRETTSVVGTGAVTLLGAVTGFQSFSTIGNANTTYYCISDQAGANWEVGIGTYTSAGTLLARTTVLASSNAGALVSFTAGTKDVFVTYPSEKGVWYDASGNVGIGTSSPAKKLDVLGEAQISFNSTNTYLYYQSTNNYTGRNTDGNMWMNVAGGYSNIFGVSGVEKMRIDTSGNVGIGTTAPNNKLTVGAPNSTVGSYTVASFSGVNAVASNSSGMVAITSTDSIAADIGGSIGFAANGTLAGYPTGSIAGRRENATAGDYSSYMQFTTSSSGGSVQEKMRIDSSGNVGIGVTDFSPTGANAKFAISLGSINLDDAKVLSWGGGSARPYITASKSSAYLAMGVSGTERMRIDSSGNVGIGLTSPTGKLDVAGTIKTLGYTVTTLPTGVVGARAYVTDALTPVYGSTVVAGGAVTIPVFYNGTNWTVG